MSEVAVILNRAADLIETRGWCQHNFQAGGSYCAVGAIRAVAADAPSEDAAWHVLRDEIRRDPRWSDKTIADWNDAPRRTKDEVVAKLREVAALADAESSQP